MATTQPVRSRKAVEELKDFYRRDMAEDSRKGKNAARNYTLLIVGFNTALRISDILHLTWKDVFHRQKVKTHIIITEQKTGKENTIFLNETVRETLQIYYNLMKEEREEWHNPYLFPSPRDENRPLSRCQAYRIVRFAAEENGLEHISCHSLRKTFGYLAWKSGVSLAVLTCIYNHSSWEITKRYLGISQDEKDEAYAQVMI